MTGAPISARDLERLSAYIDGQLPPAEAAEIQARLAVEPDLKELFRELSWTAEGLKGLPAHPAPRRYRLTPEMVGQSAPAWRLPALRLATAVVAVALVAVVGLDAIQTSGGTRLIGLPMGAQAPLAEDAGQLAGTGPDAGAANTPLLGGGETDKSSEPTPELALRAAVASAEETTTPAAEVPPMALAAPPGEVASSTPPEPEAFADSLHQNAQAPASSSSPGLLLRLTEILLGVALVFLVVLQARRRT